jgi:hypothetical protein
VSDDLQVVAQVLLQESHHPDDNSKAAAAAARTARVDEHMNSALHDPYNSTDHVF